MKHNITVSESIESTTLANVILGDMKTKGVIADYELTHNIKDGTIEFEYTRKISKEDSRLKEMYLQSCHAHDQRMLWKPFDDIIDDVFLRTIRRYYMKTNDHVTRSKMISEMYSELMNELFMRAITYPARMRSVKDNTSPQNMSDGDVSFIVSYKNLINGEECQRIVSTHP